MTDWEGGRENTEVLGPSVSTALVVAALMQMPKDAADPREW